MSWNDLSMKDKASYIRMGVENGITDLDTIREVYNKFAEGGKIGPTYNKQKKRWFNSHGQQLLLGRGYWSEGAERYVQYNSDGTVTKFTKEQWANKLNDNPGTWRQLPDYDKTKVGQLINFVENKDSIGFDKNTRRWYRPTKPGYDRNNLGMGVDINKNPLIQGKVKKDSKGREYITEEDEREARYKSIQDASRVYENNRLPHLFETLNTNETPSNDVRNHIISAIYNMGSGRVSNTLFSNKEDMKAMYGSPFSFIKDNIGKYYNQYGIGPRINNELKFYESNKKSLGGNLYGNGGNKSRYKSSSNIRKQISTWEGATMKTNTPFEKMDTMFNQVLPKGALDKLSQKQLDGLYSFAYNVGTGRFKTRTTPTLSKYLAGQATLQDVQNTMWAAKDSKLRGLANRRKKERSMLGAYVPVQEAIPMTTPLATPLDITPVAQPIIKSNPVIQDNIETLPLAFNIESQEESDYTPGFFDYVNYINQIRQPKQRDRRIWLTI
nr:MAG: lysozyme [Bacteriophage sp.]